VAERRHGGFTLLEVMVAVAMLGILTAVLVRLSSQGAMAEGEARRRLEASLLADQLLVELEGAWRAGAPVETGRREEAVGDFRVVVDVAPLDPAAFGMAALVEDARGRTDRRRGPSLAEGPPALLVGAGRSQPPLSVVTVAVSWLQGVQEQAVTRTTFAFDRQAAAPLLEPLAAEAGIGAGDVELVVPDELPELPQ
jgi:prepilin-type N-terminal cleavage/methylation domain-containing protein